VLANDLTFADALAGSPLAAAKHGPLLLNPADTLDPRVAAEVQRVVPQGATVFVLGGGAAIKPGVEDELTRAGYHAVRYGGANRFATAVEIADQGLNNPATVLEATGMNFADALSGGAAASHTVGAVLLTNDATQAPETAAYLGAHPGDTRYALGGPAAAADPAAKAYVGSDRYETSTIVAQAFFANPTTIGFASANAFADAVSGGAHISVNGGPIILVPASGPLPSNVQSYVLAQASQITRGWLYGGPLAAGDDVKAELARSIG